MPLAAQWQAVGVKEVFCPEPYPAPSGFIRGPILPGAAASSRGFSAVQ